VKGNANSRLLKKAVKISSVGTDRNCHSLSPQACARDASGVRRICRQDEHLAESAAVGGPGNSFSAQIGLSRGPPSILAETRRQANVRFQLRLHSGVAVGSVDSSKHCCVGLEGIVRLSKCSRVKRLFCIDELLNVAGQHGISGLERASRNRRQ
jgi:hypothetical protein